MSDQTMTLALSDGPARNVNLSILAIAWPEFVTMLSIPEAGPKDGSYIVRGPCESPRCDDNLPEAQLAILDGDHGIDTETGEEIEAPHPATAHQALRGLTHVVLTTHSHRNEAPRWRAFLPVSRPYSRDEAEAVTRALHRKLIAGGCLVAYSGESQRWSQPWFLPRLREESAPFDCYASAGNAFPVDLAVQWWARQSAFEAMKRERARAQAPAPSVPTGGIDAFNASHSIEAMLQAAGYRRAGTRMINGREASRWASPHSEGVPPGVYCFRHRTTGKEIVYCHDTADPLAIGKHLDAYDVANVLGVR